MIGCTHGLSLGSIISPFDSLIHLAAELMCRAHHEPPGSKRPRLGGRIGPNADSHPWKFVGPLGFSRGGLRRGRTTSSLRPSPWHLVDTRISPTATTAKTHHAEVITEDGMIVSPSPTLVPGSAREARRLSSEAGTPSLAQRPFGIGPRVSQHRRDCCAHSVVGCLRAPVPRRNLFHFAIPAGMRSRMTWPCTCDAPRCAAIYLFLVVLAFSDVDVGPTSAFSRTHVRWWQRLGQSTTLIGHHFQQGATGHLADAPSCKGRRRKGPERQSRRGNACARSSMLLEWTCAAADRERERES